LVVFGYVTLQVRHTQSHTHVCARVVRTVAAMTMGVVDSVRLCIVIVIVIVSCCGWLLQFLVLNSLRARPHAPTHIHIKYIIKNMDIYV